MKRPTGQGFTGLRLGLPGLRLGLCAVLALIAMTRPANATDATVSADASVNTAHPTTNFGSLSNLYVGNGNTALIQFDLSSLPAGSSAPQIARATLKLYVNRLNASGTVSVQPITSSWTEFAVTNATLPSLGTAFTSFTAGAAGQFVVVDVTAQVQSWVATPASNFGVALSSSSANVLFDSKENDETSHVAHLDITVVSQGPTGPQGPQGATGAQGPTGIQGPVGATGPTGAEGPSGPAGAVGLTYRQAWSNTAAYVATDSVTFDGSTYIAISSNTGQEPDLFPAVWNVIAMAGATGAAGPQGSPGATGAAGPQGIPGATGSAGPQGSPGATGATGPQGSPGATGPAGPQGTPGTTGAAGPQGTPGATGAAGPQGTPGAMGSQGPAGPTGPTGPAGPQGDSPHLFLANVALGAANSSTQFFSPTSSGEPSFGGLLLSYNAFATTLPIGCTFDSLYLVTGPAIGTFSSPITITLFQNGAATPLTSSIQPPATNTLVTAQATGQSVVVQAGDTLAVQAHSTSFNTSGGQGPYANISVSIHCQ